MTRISSANPHRPDPVLTVDTAFFWKAADEGRFVAQQCGGCQTLWHPPRAVCPKCLSLEKQAHDLSGKGVVMSWIMPIHPPAHGFDAPPIVALVEVEEGLRFVTSIEGIDPREMKNGMAVEVAFARTKGGHQVPIFVPVEAA